MTPRSKTLAAWLAIFTGALGGHRFYLHGWRDVWGWAHVPFALAGAAGVIRMRTLGVDDRIGSMLAPLLGLVLSAAMLAAIVYALTPDEKWAARFNHGTVVPTGWGAVLAAIAALMLGGVALLGSIAFAGQQFFEWQMQQDRPAAAHQGKTARLMA